MKLSNEEIRNLWLSSNLLQNTKTQNLNVLQIIKDLGFVQLDTIQNVARAHDHILWSRNKLYKEDMINDLLGEKGNIFEHFTHDASVLPVDFFPIWKGSFNRIKEKIDKSPYYKNILDENGIKKILDKIKENGAVHSSDFKNETQCTTIYKTTLDYLWNCGILTTSHRNKFKKYYHFLEDIIPENILNKNISEEEQINILCIKALEILGVANSKEIKNFWETLSTKEVNNWIKNNKENLLEIQWENNEGEFKKSYSFPEIKNKLKNLQNSDSEIKIINPFDPAVRERKRLKAIFNFDYKIEIFVPKEKRIWGYYVYPILQGNKFIGRIEIKADRKNNQLNVLNFWKENGVIWDDKKQKKLDDELSSFGLLAGINNVNWV